MTDPAAEIERIVLEVLAEMGLWLPSPTCGRGAGGEGADGQARSVSSSPLTPDPAFARGEGTAGDWTVRQRVVTLACLPERWEGVRRVVVGRGAVVTPAVRDEIQRRNVALALDGSAAEPRSGIRVRLVTTDGSYNPAGVTRALEEDGYSVDVQQRDCLIEATDELAEDLAGGLSAALLLTRHAAAAVCLANRRAGVRAVRATTVDGVASEAEAVGANLLVVDPHAQGLYPLRQMARGFLRGAPRACPEVFRQRLE